MPLTGLLVPPMIILVFFMSLNQTLLPPKILSLLAVVQSDLLTWNSFPKFQIVHRFKYNSWAIWRHSDTALSCSVDLQGPCVSINTIPQLICRVRFRRVGGALGTSVVQLMLPDVICSILYQVMQHLMGRNASNRHVTAAREDTAVFGIHKVHAFLLYLYTQIYW